MDSIRLDLTDSSQARQQVPHREPHTARQQQDTTKRSATAASRQDDGVESSSIIDPAHRVEDLVHADVELVAQACPAKGTRSIR